MESVAVLLKQNFYLFFQSFWDCISNEKFVDSKHIQFICTELDKLGKKIINKEKPDYDWLLINVPPGSSKSTIVSISFPTWLITNDPSLFIINTSYSHDLAISFIRKSKLIFRSEMYVNLFGKLQLTKDNEGHIETKQGGGRYATSTGGTITGVHGNVNIFDDPLSVQQSHSESYRNSANQYITETLSTRVRDKEKTPIIGIMQRLHENDPCGYIRTLNLHAKDIILPAELTEYTTNPELYTKKLLDPIRMNTPELEKFKRILGSYGYSGQFQQTPSPDEGGKIKRDWFEIINSADVPRGTFDIWIDGAYTKNTNNDPTGIDIFLFQKNTLYWIFSYDKYLEMPEFLKFMDILRNEYQITQRNRIFIEPKASGKTMKQLLANKKFSAIEIKTDLLSESKIARVDATSPIMESEKVKLVKGNWNDEVLHQLVMFPNGNHDEHIDNLCYSIDKYFYGKNDFMSM